MAQTIDWPSVLDIRDDGDVNVQNLRNQLATTSPAAAVLCTEEQLAELHKVSKLPMALDVPEGSSGWFDLSPVFVGEGFAAPRADLVDEKTVLLAEKAALEAEVADLKAQLALKAVVVK